MTYRRQEFPLDRYLTTQKLDTVPHIELIDERKIVQTFQSSTNLIEKLTDLADEAEKKVAGVGIAGSQCSLSPSSSPVSLDESESTYTEHLVKTKFKEVTYQGQKMSPRQIDLSMRSRGGVERAGMTRRAVPSSVCAGKRQDVAPVWKQCLQDEPPGRAPAWKECLQEHPSGGPSVLRQGTFLQTSPRFIRPPPGHTTKGDPHHQTKVHQEPHQRETFPVYHQSGHLRAYPEDSHVISSIVKRIGGPHVTYRRRSGANTDDDTTPRRECLDASVNTDPFVHRVNASVVNIVSTSDEDKVNQQMGFEPFCRSYQIQELPQLNIRPRLVKQSGPIIDIKEAKPPSPKNNVAIVEYTHTDPNPNIHTSNLQDQNYGLNQQIDPTKNYKELKLMKITKEFYKKLKSKEGLNVNLMCQKLEILISHLEKLNPSQMANYKFANMDLMSANESIDTLFVNMDLVTEILLNEMKKIQTLGRYCSIHSSIVKAVELLCQNITSIFAFDESAKMAKNLSGPPQSDTSTKGEVKTKLRRQKMCTKEQRSIVKDDSKKSVKSSAQSSSGAGEQDSSISTVRDVVVPTTRYIPYRQLVPGGRFAGMVEEAEEPQELELRSRRLARIYQISQTLSQEIRPSQDNTSSESKSKLEEYRSQKYTEDVVKLGREHVLNQTFVIENTSDVEDKKNEDKSKQRNSAVKNIEVSPKNSGTTVFYEDDWEKDDSGEITKDESNKTSSKDGKVAKISSEESAHLNESMSTSEGTASRPRNENCNTQNKTKKSFIFSTKSVQTDELCHNIGDNIDRFTIFDPCCHIHDFYSPRSFIIEKIVHKENVIVTNKEIQTEETMSNDLVNINKIQSFILSNNEHSTIIKRAEQNVNNYEQRTTAKDREQRVNSKQQSIAATKEPEEQNVNNKKQNAATATEERYVNNNDHDTVINRTEEKEAMNKEQSTIIKKTKEGNIQKDQESSLTLSQFQPQPLPVLRLTNAKTNSLLEVRFPDQSDKFEGSLTVQTSEKNEEIKLLYNTKDQANMRSAEFDKMHSVVEHLPQLTTMRQIPIVKEDDIVIGISSDQGAGETPSAQQTNVQNFESITTNFVEFLETKVTEMVNKFRLSDINERKTTLIHDKFGIAHCITNLNTHESIKKSFTSLFSDQSNRSNEEAGGLKQLMSSRGSTPAVEREHFPNLTSPNVGLVLKKDPVSKSQESLEVLSQVPPVVYNLKVQGESSNISDNKTGNWKITDVLVHSEQKEIDLKSLMKENLKAPEMLTLNKTEIKRSSDRLLRLPLDVLDKYNNGQAVGSVDLCEPNEDSTMPLWKESDEDMPTMTVQQVEKADDKIQQDCHLLPLPPAVEPLAFESDTHSEASPDNVETQMFQPGTVDQELPQFLSPYPGNVSRNTAVQAKTSSVDVLVQTSDKQDSFQVYNTQNVECTKSESITEAKLSTLEVSVGSTASSRQEDSSQTLVKPSCSVQISSVDAGIPADELCLKITETGESADDWRSTSSDLRRNVVASEAAVQAVALTGDVPLPPDLPPGNNNVDYEEQGDEDSLHVFNTSDDSILIRPYNSDDMSEGEVGFVYTYNSYSSGEVKLKIHQSEESSCQDQGSDEEGRRLMFSPHPDGIAVERGTAEECRVGTVGSSSDESTSTGELRRMFTQEERQPSLLRSSTPLSNGSLISPEDTSATV